MYKDTWCNGIESIGKRKEMANNKLQQTLAFLMKHVQHLCVNICVCSVHSALCTGTINSACWLLLCTLYMYFDLIVSNLSLLVKTRALPYNAFSCYNGLLTKIRDRRVSSMHAGKCSAIVHVVVCGWHELRELLEGLCWPLTYMLERGEEGGKLGEGRGEERGTEERDERV